MVLVGCEGGGREGQGRFEAGVVVAVRHGDAHHAGQAEAGAVPDQDPLVGEGRSRRPGAWTRSQLASDGSGDPAVGAQQRGAAVPAPGHLRPPSRPGRPLRQQVGQRGGRPAR